MSEHVRKWRRLVASLEASGLSRAAFCRRHRLNYDTMTYWLRRLKTLDGQAGGGRRAGHTVRADGQAAANPRTRRGRASSKHASFVEVSLPAMTAPAPYEVQLGNGRSIRIGPDFDDEALGRLIRTVESC